MTTTEPASPTCERRPQPLLINSPEVVLLTVDQNHRNLLGVPVGQRLIIEDGKLKHPDSGVFGYPLDHGPRVVTQMAARLTDQGDPGILARRRHLGRVDRLPDRHRFRRPPPIGKSLSWKSRRGEDGPGGAAVGGNSKTSSRVERMSRREHVPRPVRVVTLLAPVVLPVMLVMVLVALKHPRVIYTSDSAAQQSIVRTWLDVGHGTTFVPRDTWALKVPLYLLLENLPLLPKDRMLAAVLVLNALTFLILGWAVRKLAGIETIGVRWYEVTAPLAWLAALGGGIGSNRMLANYRNIELGLCFVMFATLAGYLATPRTAPDDVPPSARTTDDPPNPPADDRTSSNRPATGRRTLGLSVGAALLLGVLWFDDPYIELLVAAPLTVAALGWFLIRERDRRLLRVAAVLAASFIVTMLLRVVAGWFGIEFADAGHTLALSPADLSRHLSLLGPGTDLLLGTDRWDRPAVELIAQGLVIVVIAAMLMASAALAWHGWRQRRFTPAFLGAHWPLVVGGFMVSWHTQDASGGRYLVLAVCDVAVATAVLLPQLRIRRPRLTIALVGLIAVGAAFSFGTGAASAIDAASRPSAALPHQEDVVRAVERAVDEHGAVKGYAPFWAANITSYLAGKGTTATEIVCRDGRLGTRQWLSDSVRLTRPAKAVFLIWDPTATSLAGCPASIRDAQLGRPLAIYPVAPAPVPTPAGGINEVLVYSPDIEARLGPGDGA